MDLQLDGCKLVARVYHAPSSSHLDSVLDLDYCFHISDGKLTITKIYEDMDVMERMMKNWVNLEQFYKKGHMSLKLTNGGRNIHCRFDSKSPIIDLVTDSEVDIQQYLQRDETRGRLDFCHPFVEKNTGFWAALGKIAELLEPVGGTFGRGQDPFTDLGKAAIDYWAQQGEPVPASVHSFMAKVDVTTGGKCIRHGTCNEVAIARWEQNKIDRALQQAAMDEKNARLFPEAQKENETGGDKRARAAEMLAKVKINETDQAVKAAALAAALAKASAEYPSN